MPWSMNDQAWTGGAGADQVFINGIMVPEARWPNLAPNFNPACVTRDQLARASSGQVLNPGSEKEGKLGSARYQFPDLFRSGVSLNNTRIFFVAGCQWTPMTGVITGKEGDSVTFSCKAFPEGRTWEHPVAGSANVYHARANDPFYLWGSLGLLDSPGEWVRESNSMIYLWFHEEFNFKRDRIEAKRRSWAFDIKDRQNIIIADLKIFAAGISSNTSSSNLLIDSIYAQYVSHGTWFGGWWGNPVEPNEMTHSEGTIQLRGPNSEIRNSRIEYSAGAGIVLAGNNSRAVNNVVENVGYSGTGAGISARGSGISHRRAECETFLIAQNTVRGTGYLQCVDIYNVRNTKVTFNDLSESARLTTDNGVLFGARQLENTEISYNHLHDSHGLGKEDGWEHYYGNSGIYLQDQLTNVTVHHNVIWNCRGGIGQLNAGNEEKNNQNVLILNNTVLAPLHRPKRVHFINNLSAYSLDVWPEPIDNVANLLFTFGKYDKRKPDGAPLPHAKFTDAKSGDFTLQADSPAIDKGQVIGPWTKDFKGKAPDMGAYEFEAPKWQPGARGRHVRPPDPSAMAQKSKKEAFANAVEEATAKMLSRYPEIGKAGSAMNAEFVMLAKAARAEEDEVMEKMDWPLILAARAAENLERKKNEAKIEGIVSVAELIRNLEQHQGKQVTISGKVTKVSIAPPSFIFFQIDERVRFKLPVMELLPESKKLPRLQMKDGKVVALTFRGSLEPPKAASAKPDGFKELAELGMMVKVRGQVEMKEQDTAALIGPQIMR